MPAKAAETGEQEKVGQAAQTIYEVMNLISELYIGGDVTADEMFDAAVGAISKLLDPYSQYMSERDLYRLRQPLMNQFYGIGVSVFTNGDGRAEIGKVLRETPAEAAGLMKGDIIAFVDGTDVTGMQVDEIVAMITGESAAKVKIEIYRGLEKKTFNITKSNIKLQTVYVEEFDSLIPEITEKTPELGYIHMETVGEGTAADMRKAIGDMKGRGVTGIVLDLRGNGGGYLEVIMDICRQMVPKGPIVYTIDKSKKRVMHGSELEETPFENVVVLVDGDTASAAEVLATALQDSGAAVVGEKTYGKGVVQTLFSFPEGGLKITTEEYLRRSGAAINNIGIAPDVAIEPPAAAGGGEGGELVKVKKILEYIGYETGGMDESYDEITRESVKKHQKSRNLEATGELDEKTIGSLNFTMMSLFYEYDLPLRTAYEILKGKG